MSGSSITFCNHANKALLPSSNNNKQQEARKQVASKM
jgi:hypothetical protein